MDVTLYTLGYERRTVEEFLDLLARARIGVVIDVREVPLSRRPGFSKAALRDRLAERGIEYVHARFAGNPLAIRSAGGSPDQALARYAGYLDRNEPILAEFDRLVATASTNGRRVCLTCLEREPDACHRSILAGRWAARGPRQVTHLG